MESTVQVTQSCATAHDVWIWWGQAACAEEWHVQDVFLIDSLIFPNTQNSLTLNTRNGISHTLINPKHADISSLARGPHSTEAS